MENLVENATILVVDDNPTNIKLVCNILKKEGYNLAVAMNGQDALEIIESNPIDLILLDIMMPGMDGYEVCTKLKETQAYKDIPVIFISALSDIDDITKGYDVGGADFITKPVKEREVLSRVKTQLELIAARKTIQFKLIDKAEPDAESSEKENFMKKLLPTEEHFRKHFSDSLVVSSDHEAYPSSFYWLNEQNNNVILAMVESRIKDIPGTSFNVIGLTLLNQLPLEQFPDRARGVVDHLLPAYLKTLRDFGYDDFTSDDISIGVVAFNKQDKVLRYACNQQICLAFQSNGSPGSPLKNSHFLNGTELIVNYGLRLYLFSERKEKINGPSVIANESDFFVSKLRSMQSHHFKEQKSLLKSMIADMNNEGKDQINLTLIGIELNGSEIQ
jgi:CheY-like chemotaxis protein